MKTKRITKPAARAAAFIFIILSFGASFLPWFSDGGGIFWSVVGVGSENIGNPVLPFVLLTVLGVLLALSCLLALILCLRGSKGAVGLYFLFSLSLLFIPLVYFPGIRDFFDLDYVFYFFQVGIFGLGAWLCPLFAMIAFILMFVTATVRIDPEDDDDYRPVTPVREGSFCPTCGTPVTPGSAFCTGCGRRL